MASRAIEAVRRHRRDEKNLFLAVGFYRPHLPWTAPQWCWDLYDRGAIDLADNPFFPENAVGKSDLCDFRHYWDEEVEPLFSDIGRYADDDFPVLSEAKQRECIHAYWASVSFMDAQVGRVLDEIDRLGMTEETAIVFWGDNGWHLGEHKLWSKVTHFDESTRVPLLLSIPGKTHGETTREIVEIVDVYPTLAEAAGLHPPAHLHGTPLPTRPLPPSGHSTKPALSVCHNGRTLITDRYRFTRYPDAGKNPLATIPGRGEIELFDHAVDRGENRNVAHQPDYADISSKLSAELEARYATTRDPAAAAFS